MECSLHPHPTLIETVSSISGSKIVVIGDAMLDRFVYGTVSRVSPEAPIPVLGIARETAVLGGAANVVNNASSLGGAVQFLTVIGDDLAGAELATLIKTISGATPNVLTETGRITTTKTRYIASGQQLMRGDRETTDPISDVTAERLLKLMSIALPARGVLVLSDYGKGVLANSLAHRLIKAAKTAEGYVIVDPKGRDYSIYANADIITPNRRELAEATSMAVDTDSAIVDAANRLLDKHQFGAVLVTRSEHGMSLVTKDGAIHLPAQALEVFDVSGAGDTVVATLGLAVSAGATLPDAVRLANIAAGIAVAKVGTATVRPDELLSALNPTTRIAQKIVTIDAAAEAAERWRQRGWRVGFTNGCFDLLHPGHIHLLEQARAHCDRLIVGINRDESARRLKGANRPVQSEHARAVVLAGLGTVDIVCSFEDDTPLALIEAIRPSLIVKGANYLAEDVVGRHLVQSWGGTVLIATLLNGHSTTATLAKLRA